MLNFLIKETIKIDFIKRFLYRKQNLSNIQRTAHIINKIGKMLKNGLMSEDGSRKSEVGSRKPEVGRRKTEVRRRKTEVRRRKSEVGRRKTEVRRRKTEDGRRNVNASRTLLSFRSGNCRRDSPAGRLGIPQAPPCHFEPRKASLCVGGEKSPGKGLRIGDFSSLSGSCRIVSLLMTTFYKRL